MVQFGQEIHDKSRATVKMDDEWSSLRLNIYLFSSADTE